MNIAQAKEQVLNTVKAYSTKNENGNYILEAQQQRPLFLMGPPGIGKTAVVKQVAEELGLALVSYSITHHTRQSALGLPKIVHKKYGEEEYDVSEYTMSEIISSIYDCIEDSGAKEGILFLDEVNCASETLTPTMLQFLQFKMFGRHKVPEGWIVVTAGNPVTFNRSAREFDIVTWDRLKRVDIEPDFDAWKVYAYRHGTHASVLTYLDVRKENFYKTDHHWSSFGAHRGYMQLISMILPEEKPHIMRISPTEQTTSSVSTICATTWSFFRTSKCSGSSTTPSWTRSTQFLLMKQGPRSSFQAPETSLPIFIRRQINSSAPLQGESA